MKDHNQWQCASCYANNSNQHTFCIRCGAKRPAEKRCRKCGTIVSLTQRYCFDCGTPIDETIMVTPRKFESPHTSVSEGSSDINCRASSSQMNQNPKRYCIKCGKPVNGAVYLCEKCQEKKRKNILYGTRAIAAVLVVALLSGITAHLVGSRMPKVKNAEQAISVLKDMGEELGYENAFSELTEKNITTIDGDTYYRLQQNYEGIPVYGKNIVCVTNDKSKIEIISANISDIFISNADTPLVDEEQLQSSISNYLINELNYDTKDLPQISELDQNDLCIYSDQNSNASYLAYDVDCPGVELIINATTADILMCTKTINADVVECYGSDDNNSFNAFQETNGQFVLCDTDSNIYIFDAANQTYYNMSKSTVSPEVLTLVTSSDRVFGNENDTSSNPQSSYNVFCALSDVYDYYSKTFHEQGCGVVVGITNDKFGSYDGENAGAKIYRISEVLNTNLPGYDSTLSNGYAGIITFGTKYCEDIENHIDTLGHEYTHYISEYRVDWDKTNKESGAIDEGLADIFGEIIEAKKKNRIDWIHLDRTIYNPTINSYPKTVGEKGQNIFGNILVKTHRGEERTTDYAHGYSTVISHSAYLMWNGIDENTAMKIDMDTLAELWYRAMLLMPPDCNFVECRTLVEVAASNMNLTDLQKQCVSEAFDRVGIQPASEEEYLQLVHLLVTEGGPAIKGAVYEKKTVDGVETVVRIPDAVVTVYSEGSKRVQEKLNLKNENGRFEIKLPAGTYSVSITAEGYNGQTVTLSLHDNEVRYFSFALDPIERDNLEEENVLSGKCGDNLTWTLKNGVLTISGNGSMPSYDLPSIIPWFDYMHEITKIVVEDGVTNISNSAFSYHDKVTSISIGDSVTSIGSGAFYDCVSLTNITIPDGVKTIKTLAFYRCSKLESITLPKSLSTIESSAFEKCDKLSDVYYGGSKADWNAIKFEEDNEYLLNATIHYAVEDDINVITGTCGKNLTWKLNNGVLTISGNGKMDNYDYEKSTTAPWHNYHDSISSVVIEEGVTSIGEDAFSYCEKLTEVHISDSVTSIGKQAFEDCNMLKKVFIGAGVSEINNTALKSCKNLAQIDVSGKNRYYCSQDGVLFNKNNTILDTYPMGKDSSTYSIPNGVTEIAWGAFSGNEYLKQIVIPNGVTKIGNLAFSQCTQLNSLIIPNSVKTVGSMAFTECSNIVRIDIPKSITSLGELAFANCWNLKEIKFQGDACNIGLNAFMYVEAKAYYPAGNASWTANIRQNYGGEITWIAEGEAPQTGKELSAYRPVVEQIMRDSGYSTADSYTQSYCQGILLDLDGDGVKELVLQHLSNSDPYLGADYLLSVYDYENGKVVVRLKDVSFGSFGLAGASGYVTIVYKSGAPYIMTHRESGETSGSGAMLPNRTEYVNLYDGKTYQKAAYYWIDRYENVMSYEINGKPVSQNAFIKSVEAYNEINVICDMYDLIEASENLIAASKLLEQLK